MKQDYIIILAWPEGYVASADSWYDYFLAKKGKYRVGHSAIVLINGKTSESNYFDFGRYHTPKGLGRVRDKETDPDLTLPDVLIQNKKIENIEEILLMLYNNKSTHGKGKMYASILRNVDFELAYFYAKGIQNKGMLSYGPFTIKGTNCSRFTAAVIRNSNPSVIKKLRLRFPFCISPSPKRNVSIVNNNYYIVSDQKCKKVKKTKLQAYFTSIEK